MGNNYCNKCNKTEGFIITKNKGSQECLLCTCSKSVTKSGYDLCNECYKDNKFHEHMKDRYSGSCETINCVCIIDTLEYHASYPQRHWPLCRCCHYENKRNGCVHKMPHIPRIESNPGGRKTDKYYVYILKSIKGKSTDEIKKELNKQGIKVSGKSPSILKDIYMYSQLCGINIKRE